MLGTAWVTLRQAQEALKNGRLEEAHSLLTGADAQGHKRSYELLQQLAQGFIERGERVLRQDDSEAAWRDLLRAEQIGMVETAAANLREPLTRVALAEVRAHLEMGEPARALEAVTLLRERLVTHADLQRLEETARDWSQAIQLADRGEFAPALMTAQRLQRHQPLPALDRFREELDRRREALTVALGKLHEAVGNGGWREALRLADEVLSLAPDHAEARKARTRAWQAIEPSTVGVKVQTVATTPAPAVTSQRYLLWIDGVGGYLVCLDPRVTLGQALPDASVDIPLFADVSRLHATLTRDSEGYMLEGARPVAINNQTADRALLRSGDRITLGSSCQMMFQQSVPISATARLDIVSGHRLALAVDAVLLMAETLVLGPGTQAHVAMPELRQPVVLFRQKGGLGVRTATPFTVDGQRVQERSSLGPRAVVKGEDFAFALEPVGVRLGSVGV